METEGIPEIIDQLHNNSLKYPCFYQFLCLKKQLAQITPKQVVQKIFLGRIPKGKLILPLQGEKYQLDELKEIFRFINRYQNMIQRIEIDFRENYQLEEDQFESLSIFLKVLASSKQIKKVNLLLGQIYLGEFPEKFKNVCDSLMKFNNLKIFSIDFSNIGLIEAMKNDDEEEEYDESQQEITDNSIKNMSILSDFIERLSKNKYKQFSLYLSQNQFGVNFKTLQILSQGLSNLFISEIEELFLDFSYNLLGKYYMNCDYLGQGFWKLMESSNLKKLSLQLFSNDLGENKQNLLRLMEPIIMINCSKVTEFNLNLFDNNLGQNFENMKLVGEFIREIIPSQIEVLGLNLEQNQLGSDNKNMYYLCENLDKLKSSRVHTLNLNLGINEFQDDDKCIENLAVSLIQLKDSNIQNLSIKFDMFDLKKKQLKMLKQLAQVEGKNWKIETGFF